VRGRDVLDQLGGAHQPADAPAGGVKVLAGGADGDGDLFDFRGQGGDAGEVDVVEAVVDFVGQDDDLVLYAEVGDLLEFGFGVDFADGVVFWEEGSGGLVGCVSKVKDDGGVKNIRGVLRTSILVLGVMAFSSSSKSMVHSPAERVLTPPSLGGCMGT